MVNTVLFNRADVFLFGGGKNTLPQMIPTLTHYSDSTSDIVSDISSGSIYGTKV